MNIFKRLEGPIWLFVAFVIIGLLGATVNRLFESDDKEVYQQGWQAYTVGIPATANPYHTDNNAANWLNGWMDSKIETGYTKP